jgi:hypothetical protein
MSFGVGVGDVVTFGRHSWKAYQLWKNAPKSFKDISIDVLALLTLLEEVDKIFSGQSFPESRRDSLAKIRRGCDSILDKLQSIIDKHKSLGSDNKRTMDRLTWPSKDIDKLWVRLHSYITMIGTFVK